MAGTGSQAAYILRACPWKMSPSGGLVWTPTRPPPWRPVTCPSDLVDTWLILQWWALSPGRTPFVVRQGGHPSAERKDRPGWKKGIWERIGRILLWSHLPSISRRILFAGLLNQSRVHLVMPGRFARCSGARCTLLYEKLLYGTC